MRWFSHIVNDLTLYDLTSGWIPCAALLTGLWSLLRRHNCYERRCVKVGTHRSQLDSHVRCRRHHDAHKTSTAYVDAKDQ